jgi:putative peptide zinc metalloprotease protein
MGLPRNLRQDLELIEARTFEDGSPRWRLYDPAANRFYDLGGLEVEILSELRRNPNPDLSSADLAKIIAERERVMCSSQQIDDFVDFLLQHDLFWIDGERALEGRKTLAVPQWRTWRDRAWRQYLFLRVPILQPDRLLDRMLPWLQWAFRPITWWALALNAVFAIYLTSRQADYFFGTFVSYFTPLGVLYFSIAVVVAKVLHEFGHALVARQFGCSVRAMGVALLVFWPILYTDTTDAWRLRSPRKRLLIAASGMLVELGLASICLLLWNLSPEGVIRNILFMLSTTTWILTLAINLNPLMRFDGYYIFSDLSGVENLQDRANVMGRWKLRELLFGYGRTAPERGRRWLIVFAYAMWIYRLFIFFGIAYLVYTYFFKVLGIILAAAQVFRMLVVPIGKELSLWWKWREEATQQRAMRSASVLMVMIILFSLPLDRQLELPAYWQARSVMTLYAPLSGQLDSLPPSNIEAVAAGETVVVISSPDLLFELDQAEHDIRSSQYELERTSFNAGLAQERLSLQARLSGALEKRVDLRAQLEDASLVAPFAARVAARQPDLREGDWVSKGDRLLTLIDDTAGEVVAFVSESELRLLRENASGSFYPEGGIRGPQTANLVEVDGFAVDTLDQAYVASIFGGGLDVRDGEDGQLIPQRATYRILLETEAPADDRVLRGVLVIDADSRSLIAVFWRQLLGVWRRESGF